MPDEQGNKGGLSMQENKSEFDLEKAFDQLEKAVEALEQEDISLEESFQVYKNGMELLKQCNQAIDQVEKQVLVLNEDGECHEF